MKYLTVNIAGNTTDDLIEALQEVFKLVGDDYTSGFNQNETGRYRFEIDEEAI